VRGTAQNRGKAMKLELKSLGLWSVIKIGFIVNLIMGFVMGLLAALFMLPLMALMSGLGSVGMEGLDPAEFAGPIMIIVLPIVYALGSAVFGTIILWIAAVVYNLAARLLGGVEYEVTQVDARAVPPAAPVYAPAQPLQNRPSPPPASPQPPPPPREERLGDNPTDRPEGS